MVTALWSFVGVAVFVFLYRIVLWYAIKWSDAREVDIEPVKVLEVSKWLETQGNSPPVTTTGIVPGGVSYTQAPQRGGALVTKSGKRTGRLFR
jgi:hypothetical protein